MCARNQNIVLVAVPSVPGLQQAEQHIAGWMAWQEIKNTSQYGEMDSGQQQIVRKREADDLKEARTAVKNAYEIVIYLHKDSSIRARKITMGAESLLATLLTEKELRLYREKIEPTALMPGGPSSVLAADRSFNSRERPLPGLWPASASSEAIEQ